MDRRKLPLIEVDYPVFLADGADAFGAVREVLPQGRPELLVNVEGGGDFRVSLDAVDHVAAKKVVVRWDELGREIQDAIKHAIDVEDFPPADEAEADVIMPTDGEDDDAFVFREGPDERRP